MSGISDPSHSSSYPIRDTRSRLLQFWGREHSTPVLPVAENVLERPTTAVLAASLFHLFPCITGISRSAATSMPFRAEPAEHGCYHPNEQSVTLARCPSRCLTSGALLFLVSRRGNIVEHVAQPTDLFPGSPRPFSTGRGTEGLSEWPLTRPFVGMSTTTSRRLSATHR